MLGPISPATKKWPDPFESVRRALRSQSVLSFLAAVIWFSPAINHNFIVVNALAGPVIKLSSELLNLVFFPRKRLNQYQQGSEMCIACPFCTQKSNAANLPAENHPGKSARRGRRELKYVQILSQNTQGFNEDKEEIILALMQQKNIFAYAIQETWRLGSDISEKYGYYIIQHGSDSIRTPKKVIHRAASQSSSALMQSELGSKQDHVYCTSETAYSLSSSKWRTSEVNQSLSCLQLLTLLSVPQRKTPVKLSQLIWKN
jgi:hypothetical protein